MSSITEPLSTENGVKGLVKRHPLFSMYLVMFILVWSIMIPQALYAQGILAAPLPEFLEILTGWAPGIAAVLISAILAGRAGVRKLLGRFLIWRVGLGWYLVGIFSMAAIILGGIGLHLLFGGAMPVIPASGSPVWESALTFLVFLVLGYVINTEETAWRGFALPRLQSRYGAWIAAVLIAIPEALIHIPLYWEKDSFIRSIGVGWFTVFSIAAVFVYVYVFNKTGGSLLIVTMLHTSQNAWSNLLSDNSPRPFYFTVALMWILALALIFATKGRLGYRPEIPVEE
jgi:membrane protease YdiL (CAAX protease family)